MDVFLQKKNNGCISSKKKNNGCKIRARRSFCRLIPFGLFPLCFDKSAPVFLLSPGYGFLPLQKLLSLPRAAALQEVAQAMLLRCYLQASC